MRSMRVASSWTMAAPRRRLATACKNLRDLAASPTDRADGAPALASTRPSTCTSTTSRSSAGSRAHTLDGYGRDLARLAQFLADARPRGRR